MLTVGSLRKYASLGILRPNFRSDNPMQIESIPFIWLSFVRKKNTSSKWSYVMGPSTTPLLGLTIGKTLDRAADRFGDSEAVVSCYQNIRKTYTQVKTECDDLAAGLLAVGLKPGDRLGIWGPNSYEWYITQFAAAKAGLILVNINPAYRANELKYCLNKVSIKGIICAERFKTSNYHKMLSEIVPELSSSVPGELQSTEIPSLKTIIMMGDNPMSGTLAFRSIQEASGSEQKKEIEVISKELQFDAPCNIQFTSGTTGAPKGALLSHHNVVNNAYFTGKRCNYDKEPKRICILAPFYHCMGCIVGILGGTLYGCTTIVPYDGFNPKAALQSFAEEKVNLACGTPTMFVDILKEFERKPVNVESMTGGIMGGAPCPEDLIHSLRKDLKMKDFVVIFGMTETSPVTFQSFLGDPPSVRAQTLGYPSDHTEVKIVNDQDKIVLIGEPGELLVRGYCNFLGYWKDETKTTEIMGRDRWLRTGDLVTLNEDGYGKIVGRIKDQIIRGGENIYPAEVENFYMSHPDVLEAQVFGVPDERMGEEVAMWFRLKPGSILNPQSLKEWSKEKIAHYKIPRYISVKEKFPVTITGKIQKFKLKEMAIKELGLKA